MSGTAFRVFRTSNFKLETSYSPLILPISLSDCKSHTKPFISPFIYLKICSPNPILRYAVYLFVGKFVIWSKFPRRPITRQLTVIRLCNGHSNFLSVLCTWMTFWYRSVIPQIHDLWSSLHQSYIRENINRWKVLQNWIRHVPVFVTCLKQESGGTQEAELPQMQLHVRGTASR